MLDRHLVRIQHRVSSIQHPLMAIKLTYRAETSVPVEIEGLTPDWACDKSLAEIERFEIFHGNRKLPLAEMFSVTGDASDKRFDFEGNLSGVHWVGAHMRSGRIYVNGPAGRHIGSELRGGEIHVEGDAGGWVGCEMRAGFIHVQGNAGHLVGAAYRGSAKGMTGGTIIVNGGAGNEIGLSMQKGTIAIGGTAGDMIGFNMTDGMILVVGDAGIRAGAGMRGGMIAMLGPTPSPMLPSFRFDRTYRVGTAHQDPANGGQCPPYTMLRELREKGLRLDESMLPESVDVYVGDLVAEGSGEIYVRHLATSA
ncbi:MAG TPA: formylmethanofuran dehydrogenase subunit C [Lacipirellulaceae bacterium]|jgi:formylmethanofuran dehydrogenase subunit C|nr:formylmethanofuran dehydrogenase subunit C [Lacipirellulaceae bacterium]